MHTFHSMSIKGASVLNLELEVPSTFQPKIWTSGGVSDDVADREFGNSGMQGSWNTPQYRSQVCMLHMKLQLTAS